MKVTQINWYTTEEKTPPEGAPIHIAFSTINDKGEITERVGTGVVAYNKLFILSNVGSQTHNIDILQYWSPINFTHPNNSDTQEQFIFRNTKEVKQILISASCCLDRYQEELDNNPFGDKGELTHVKSVNQRLYEEILKIK